MNLLRFATIVLGSSAESWRQFSLAHDGVRVSWVETTGGPSDQLLVVAAAPLEAGPRVEPDGLVHVPEEPRRRAEAALQVAANLLSVATGGSRALSSPALPVAFQAEDADEQAWLDAQTGLADADRGFAQPVFTVLLEERHVAALGDRLEGVALLAEGLANPHLTGRFHELVRAFELAFSESANRLIVLVADFLSAWTRLGFTKTEVRRWLVRLRNPATHVDRRRRHGIVLEADLQAVIGRMTLAAYDVLLNKERWNDGSVARRDVWRPDIGPLTPDGHETFVRQHSEPQAAVQLLEVSEHSR